MNKNNNVNTTNTEDQANQAPCASKPIAPMLVELAERMGVTPSQAYMTIKATIAPKATNEELMAFCVVANQYKLNPFLKEIYAFPGKNGGIVPIVGIDGWLKLINTHPKFDGMDVEMSGDGESCTCRIYRKDNQHPTIITEYLTECKKNTDPWRQWPRRMLRHKAIMQCGRVAFGFGGIYDEDEGKDVAGGMRNVTPEKTDGPAEGETPWNNAPSPEEFREEPQDALPEPEQQDDFIPGLEIPEAKEYATANMEDY